MKRGLADEVLDEVIEVVRRWRAFADDARVDPMLVEDVGRCHRLEL